MDLSRLQVMQGGGGRPVVVYPSPGAGAGDGLGGDAAYSPFDMDELHILYVAVTRAKAKLFLSPELHKVLGAGTPRLPASGLGSFPRLIALPAASPTHTSSPAMSATMAAAITHRRFPRLLGDSDTLLFLCEALDRVSAPSLHPLQTTWWFGRCVDVMLRRSGLCLPLPSGRIRALRDAMAASNPDAYHEEEEGAWECAEDFAGTEPYQPLVPVAVLARLRALQLAGETEGGLGGNQCMAHEEEEMGDQGGWMRFVQREVVGLF